MWSFPTTKAQNRAIFLVPVGTKANNHCWPSCCTEDSERNTTGNIYLYKQNLEDLGATDDRTFSVNSCLFLKRYILMPRAAAEITGFTQRFGPHHKVSSCRSAPPSLCLFWFLFDLLRINLNDPMLPLLPSPHRLIWDLLTTCHLVATFLFQLLILLINAYTKTN